MISMAVLHTGNGYQYLTKNVAANDVDRDLDTPLVEYYANSGNPPGYWLGSGLDGIGEDGIRAGSEVTEKHMERLYRDGLDPETGERLGRAYAVVKPYKERVAARMIEVDHISDALEKSKAIAKIEREERKFGPGVAGFDHVFSPVKSVSVLWAIGDEDTREKIYTAHRQAIAEVLEHMEHSTIFTRKGAAGVAQVDTLGVIATAFDHFDSRAGDPQLHTHVVIANKVQAVDGSWVTLDSKAIHSHLVENSELHQNILADKLTDSLGVSWVDNSATKAKEIAGIPPELLEGFSQRSQQVDLNMAQLLVDFEHAHGRAPQGPEMVRLKQTAALLNRPEKDTTFTLNERRAQWAAKTEHLTGKTIADVVRDIWRKQPTTRIVTADSFNQKEIDNLANTALHTVAESKAVWTDSNLRAEVSRVTQDLRLASASERVALIDRIHAQAANWSVRLDPPATVGVDSTLVRESDGKSIFTHAGSARYTSIDYLAAEQSLLDAAERQLPAGVALPIAEVKARTAGSTLSPDQAAAVELLGSTDSQLQALIGPAGTGKTTTLKALSDAWAARHGAHSVIAMAPSAAATSVLQDKLGIDCHVTDKWIYETDPTQRAQRVQIIGDLTANLRSGKLSPRSARKVEKYRDALLDTERTFTMNKGQLIIVDEASMASTKTLSTFVSQAEKAGAKLIFVGDDRQYEAIHAGGALNLLIEDGHDVNLTELHRFTHEWEKEATQRLRLRDGSVFDEYVARGRIVGGDHDAMLNHTFSRWVEYTSQGHDTLMVAETNEMTAKLNALAQARRLGKNELGKQVGVDRNGAALHIGDIITSRNNESKIKDSTGQRIQNGHRWQVTGKTRTGHITAVAIEEGREGVTTTITNDYVKKHVHLGYASTVRTSQGATAHACIGVANERTNAQSLYVMMSRGTDLNEVAVITTPYAEHDDARTTQQQAVDVLERAIANDPREMTATQTLREHARQHDSLAHLNNQRDYLLDADDTLTWKHQLPACGLSPADAQRIVEHERFGQLAATLRAAELAKLDPNAALARAVRQTTGEITPNSLAASIARDIKAVGVPLQPGQLAVPHHTGLADDVNKIDEHRSYLREVLTRDALRAREPWIDTLRSPQTAENTTYRQLMGDIVEYRARFHIENPGQPAGPKPMPGTLQHQAFRRLTGLITRWNTSNTPPRTGPDTSRTQSIDRDRHEGLER